ncbi:MAG: DUF5320 domain-containing protein [Spirochaetaceae bacterium]|nr:DUF5320 domain-containing protein [Spirochaetaceae bacterium]
MRGNKKGPEEKGPKTGRGLGYCNGSDQPGYLSSAPLQGMGRGNRSVRGVGNSTGFGRGRGCGRGFGSVSEERNNSELVSRITHLENELKELKN